MKNINIIHDLQNPWYLVVPKDRVAEAIDRSYARERKEAMVRARLNQGETFLQIYGWDEKFGY